MNGGPCPAVLDVARPGRVVVVQHLRCDRPAPHDGLPHQAVVEGRYYAWDDNGRTFAASTHAY